MTSKHSITTIDERTRNGERKTCSNCRRKKCRKFHKGTPLACCYNSCSDWLPDGEEPKDSQFVHCKDICSACPLDERSCKDT